MPALIAATGLPLCGIADEAPSPSPASRTSATSVWARSTMSVATLPIAPAAAEGAGQLGDPGPLGVPRRRRLEPEPCREAFREVDPVPAERRAFPPPCRAVRRAGRRARWPAAPTRRRSPRPNRRRPA